MTHVVSTSLALAAALLGLVQAAPTRAASVPADSAVASARAAYQLYDNGWRAFNVDKVDGAFAPKFEWTNSVGVRVTDHAQLKRFLTTLFKQPDYNVSTTGPLDIRSIQQVATNVVVISSREVTHGQIDTSTGKVSPDFGTNELVVLRREGDRWLIVYVLDSDENHGI